MTMTALLAIAGASFEPEYTLTEAAFTQPEYWQSRARRNRLRRLEKQGIKVQRFSNWENIDPLLIG